MTFDLHLIAQYVTGADDINLYVGQWFFALLGAYLSFRSHLKTRDKSKPFSWRYMWLDNLRRLSVTAALILVFLRFPEQLLSLNLGDKGPTLVLCVAFFIGLFNDRLSGWLKQINFLGMKNSSVRKIFSDENTPKPGDPAARS